MLKLLLKIVAPKRATTHAVAKHHTNTTAPNVTTMTSTTATPTTLTTATTDATTRANFAKFIITDAKLPKLDTFQS